MQRPPWIPLGASCSHDRALALEDTEIVISAVTLEHGSAERSQLLPSRRQLPLQRITFGLNFSERPLQGVPPRADQDTPAIAVNPHRSKAFWESEIGHAEVPEQHLQPYLKQLDPMVAISKLTITLLTGQFRGGGSVRAL